MKRFRGLRVEQKSVSGAVWWHRVQMESRKRTGSERGMDFAMCVRWWPLSRPQALETGCAGQRKGLEARTEASWASNLR